ncbi:hypothetical protein SK128_013962, partial [Halocaridina rubra]
MYRHMIFTTKIGVQHIKNSSTTTNNIRITCFLASMLFSSRCHGDTCDDDDDFHWHLEGLWKTLLSWYWGLEKPRRRYSCKKSLHHNGRNFSAERE